MHSISNAGKTMKAEDNYFNGLMQMAAKKINIKSHLCGIQVKITAVSSCKWFFPRNLIQNFFTLVLMLKATSGLMDIIT